jgi:hypothetical protein
MQGFERDTLTAVLNSKRVWLTHVIGNLLLMTAFFYWTRIPDETGWQFVLTVLAGLLIVFLVLWLHSGTFLYFEPSSERQWGASLRTSLLRVPAFLLWTLIFGLVLWWTGDLWSYGVQAGGYVRHLLPHAMRSAIAPAPAFSTMQWLALFLQFFLWPILALPVGAQVAAKGFRGFISTAAFRPIREVRYWLTYAVCFVTGAYVPYLLAWILPTKPSSVGAQTWSMALRLGFGYLLLVTAWLVLCAAIMRASNGGEADAAGTKLETIFSHASAKLIVHQSLSLLRDWRVLGLQLAGAVALTATSNLESFGEKTWHIALGIAGVVVLVVAFLWLQAGTLAFAAEPDPQRFRPAFTFNFRRIGWSLLGLVVLLALMLGTVGLVRALISQNPNSTVENLVVFFLAPALVLPWIMAKVGGSRLRAGLAAIRRWEYWLSMAVLVLAAGLISDGILSVGLGSRSATGTVRFFVLLISNLPYVIAWLLIAGLLGCFVNSRSSDAPTDVIRQSVS